MKKLTMIFMVVLIFFMPIFNTYNQQTAHANVISKPLTLTAKKVAKELAQNSAVEMAEHILFEKAMAEFLETDLVQDGYKAVCLDGPKSLKDCEPSKRAQIKENLSSTDKANLSRNVETVIEKKSNTSSKWGKFLDWFVPIFLISGLVATFDSMLDGDSESLIDEIATEALVDSSLLLPLNAPVVPEQPPTEILNFAEHLTNATITHTQDSFYVTYTMKPTIKSGVTVPFSYKSLYYGELRSYSKNLYSTGDYKMRIMKSYREIINPDKTKSYYAQVLADNHFVLDTNGYVQFSGSLPILYNGTTPHTTTTGASSESETWIHANITPKFNGGINEILSEYFSYHKMFPKSEFKFSNVTIANPPVKPVVPDFTGQKAVQHIKNPDGTVTTPGIEKFKYTHGQNEIYPSPDSTTGWKEKTTGEDIQVNEDEILVDTELDAPPTEEEEEEEFPSCKKDLKKINFKKVGTAFTNAFPFSIPWDIKRFIDASFGGVGDARPSFELPDYLGSVKLEIPAFFDDWMGFMRTFVIIAFDISLIYLFYRIMRGGGGD